MSILSRMFNNPGLVRMLTASKGEKIPYVDWTAMHKDDVYFHMTWEDRLRLKHPPMNPKRMN